MEIEPIKRARLNEVMWLSPHPVGMVSFQEEEIGHTDTASLEAKERGLGGNQPRQQLDLGP